MTGTVPGPGAPGQAAPLRSGQDWAQWLRQAHAARFPPTAGPADGRTVSIALAALVHLARRHGFAVDRTSSGASQGITTWHDRRIRVPAGTTPEQAVTALAHQLGHVLQHAEIARLSPSGTVPCDGLRKVEADSVAYLTATTLGIDTTAIAFPHIPSWAGTDPRAHPVATIQTATTRILAVAATITTHLHAQLSPASQHGRPAHTTTPEPPRGHLPSVTAPPPPDEDIAQVNLAAQAFFQSKLPGSWVPGYLTARGFSDDTQRHWQAGHAPASWDALTRHLRALGFSDQILTTSGLARTSRRGTLIDAFRNRAMLPVRSGDGTVIAFIGRAPDQVPTGVPKYLNSPQTSLYDKSKTLFGLWEAREALTAGAQPVIVEGPLDAIAVTTAGHGQFAGVAPCGTALTTPHAHALSRTAGLPAAGILVAFDPDPPGRRAAVRAYHPLSQITTETSAVTLPPRHDPAQILASHGPEALATILATRTHPLADLVTDTELDQWTRWLDHPQGQLSALRATAPLIAAMPPAHVARQVARLSHRLSLDYPTVTNAVTSALPDLIASTDRPGTLSRNLRGGTAPPHTHSSHSRAGTPAQTSDDTGEQAAAQPRPPSRPASQSHAAGHEFPASATDTVKRANTTTPLPRRPSSSTPPLSRRGRAPR
jgi:DNA primase